MEGKNLQEILPSISAFMDHPAINRSFFSYGFYTRVEEANNEVTDPMLYDTFRLPEKDSGEFRHKIMTFANSYRANRKPKLHELKRLKRLLSLFMSDLNEKYKKLDSEMQQVIEIEEKIAGRKAKIADILSDPDVAALLKKKGY